MAWIQSHQALGNHPKVEKLSRILKIHRAQAIGHLHLLWWWCLDYAPEGNIANLSVEDIAVASGWTKDPAVFIDAMVGCGISGHGFLERSGSGFHVHDWDQYGGRLIERRKSEYERLKRNRSAAKAAHQTPQRHAGDTHGDTPYHTHDDAHDDAHGVGGRVERVEKRDIPATPAKRSRPPSTGAVAIFREVFLARFGIAPEISKENAIALNKLMHDHSDGEALIRAYVADDDEYVTKAGHPVGLLATASGINRLRLKLNGKLNGNGSRPFGPDREREERRLQAERAYNESQRLAAIEQGERDHERTLREKAAREAAKQPVLDLVQATEKSSS